MQTNFSKTIKKWNIQLWKKFANYYVRNLPNYQNIGCCVAVTATWWRTGPTRSAAWTSATYNHPTIQPTIPPTNRLNIWPYRLLPTVQSCFYINKFFIWFEDISIVRSSSSHLYVQECIQWRGGGGLRCPRELNSIHVPVYARVYVLRMPRDHMSDRVRQINSQCIVQFY